MTKGLLLSLKRRGSICAVRNVRGKLLAIGMMAISFLSAFAQVSSYSFLQSNGTYTALSENATVVAQATSSDYYDGQNWSATIPFYFNFNGEDFNQVNINSNGHVTFGAVTANLHESQPINSTTGFRGAIAGFAADLRAANTNDHMGQILVEEQVIEDENVFVIEYRNWSRFSFDQSKYALINFQIQLFIGGKIRIVYGDFTSIGGFNQTGEAQIGLRGTSNADFVSRKNTTTTSFTSSVAATSSNEKQAYSYATGSTQGLPTSGLTYTFTPPACWAPTSVVVSNVTTSSCTINATSTSSPTFEYEVRTSGLPGSGQAGLIASGDNFLMPITVTGLPHSSTLTVYVRAMCMEANSAWTSAQVVTLCGENTLPFLEAFNTTSMPSCWSTQVVTGTTSNGISFVTSSTTPTVNASATIGAFVRYNSGSSPSNRSERLVTPPMSTDGVTGVMVSYDFYHSAESSTSYRDSLILQYSVDNGTTWIRVAGDRRRGTDYEWERKNYILPADVVNHPSFQVGFLFKGDNGYNMYLNNVEIKQAPAPTYTAIENFVACSQAAVQAKVIGSNLTNASVTIEGVAATIVSNTFNEIVFLAPAGTYGNAVISTALGSVTTAELVDIMTPPVLTLATETETVCTGTAVEVALASPVADFTTYNWSTPANTTVTGTAEEGFTITSALDNTFILTASVDMDGRTCVAKDTFSYVAIANPVVYPNFTTLTLCEEEVQKVSFTTQQVYGPSAGTPNPFYYNFGGSRNQQLFLASELTQMGWTAGNPINAVSFEVSNVHPDTLRQYRIRINNTSLESLTETFESEFVQVFLSDIKLVAGVNTFNFNVPFNWDGVSNVIIEFAFSNENGGYTSFLQGENKVAFQPTPFFSSVVKSMDNQAPSTVYNTPVGSTAKNRSIMTFSGVTPIIPTSEYTIVWTGTDLFTDAAATTSLTSENTQTVFNVVGNTPQTITAQVTSGQGCVTNVNYTINANPVYRETLTRESCAYYEHLGQILYTSGVYVDTLSAVTGCDSIITLNLTVATPSHFYVDVTTCDAYTLGSQTLTETGVYVETFESILGCADSIVHVNFTKIEQVTAFITHQGNTLTAHPSGEEVLYQWENCATGMTVPGANNREFTPTEFGTYRVRVVQGACVGTSMCVVYSTTGITVLDEMELSVYPNPTKDNVIITFSSEDPLSATLVDATGQVVLARKVLSGDQMDIAHLAAGVYLLQVESANAIQTVRVIKQ